MSTVPPDREVRSQMLAQVRVTTVKAIYVKPSDLSAAPRGCVGSQLLDADAA